MDVDEARYDRLLGPDPAVYPCPSSSSTVWIILLVLAFLIIIGLAIWVVYLYYNRNKNNTNTREIFLVNPSFVVSDNTITAYWTNNIETEGNRYYLYATRNPPFYGSTGAVLNPSAQQNFQASSEGSSSVTVSGLSSNTKYYATLVATNPRSSTYKIFTQLVFMEASAPPAPINSVNSNFAIEHILQGGAIQLGSTGTTTSGETTYNVEYSTDPSCLRQIFFMNANSQIQFSDTSAFPNLCLYNNGGTLSARECNAANNNGDSVWTYNYEGLTNRWCLSNTFNVNGVTGATGASCMSLGMLNSTNRSGQISITNNSQPGDGWANYYRTFPPN